MKAVIQRVTDASVQVDGEVVGTIESGLLVYLGVAKGDSTQEAIWLAEKIAKLRIFQDDAGKMNRSINEDSGSVLVVSQFTLLANLRKGNRPSWDESADPDLARTLYEQFIQRMKELVHHVQCGVFGASMQVAYTNDGPATFILET